MRPIAQALRQMFEERGWNVTTLAAEIGFNRSTLQTRFTAQNPLSPRRAGDQQIIDAILKTIDASPDELEARTRQIEDRAGDLSAPLRLRDLVRRKMRDHGVSLRDLADKLGMSYPHLSNRLTSPAGLDGSKPADHQFVAQVAEALGESPTLWFIGATLPGPESKPVTLSGALDAAARDLLRSLGRGDGSEEDRARAIATLSAMFANDQTARGSLMRAALSAHNAVPGGAHRTPSFSLMLALIDLPEDAAVAFLSGEGLTPASDVK